MRPANPLKICPRCDLEAALDARACARCGHAYRTVFAAPSVLSGRIPPRPVRPPSFLLLVIIGALGLFGGMAALLGAVGNMRSPSGAKSGATLETAVGTAGGRQIPFEQIAALSFGPDGDSQKDILAHWGQPDRIDGDEWYYTAEGGNTLKLEFRPAGYFKALYYVGTTGNPAAWPQSPDLSAVRRGVWVGSGPADVRAAFPGPEVIVQRGMGVHFITFRYHHGTDSADIDFLYSPSSFRGWGAFGPGTKSPSPPPVAPSRPMQRPDGSFYPMAGFDYPADASHPAGSMNHEVAPSAAPQGVSAPQRPSAAPPAFTMRTKAGGGPPPDLSAFKRP